MTPQQSILNGFIGTLASLGAYIASVTVHEVNERLTTISLCVGITVGIWTLCRFIRHKPKP